MKGQQLCQQDMGQIMKNSKANAQVSSGSIIFSIYLFIYIYLFKVCAYCVVL